MTIKKFKICGLFGVFATCFLVHFLYNLLPLKIISFIAPVNESIWEHMKMIYTSYILYGIIEYCFIKKYAINNFIFQLFIVPIIGIIIYLCIYLPLYNLIGENMIFNIGLLFIITIIEQFVSYYILNHRELELEKTIGIIGILIVYIIFAYLTYHPIRNYIFFDSHSNKYGINIYIK